MTGRDSADTSGYLPSYSAFGAQRAHEDVVGEVLARVDDLDFHRTRGASALVDELGLPRFQLADVDGARDDFDVPVLPHPPHRDGCVQPTRIREHDSLRHDDSLTLS